MTARSLPVIPVDVRPRTRGECAGVVRPCPWTSCEMHTGAGSIAAASFLGDDIACTLDLADRGGMTLEDVSAVFGLTRERIRQIEDKAMRIMRRDLISIVGLDEYPGPGDRAVASGSHKAKAGQALRSARLDADAEELSGPAAREEAEGYRAPSFFDHHHDDGMDAAVAERVWVMFSRRHGIVSKMSAAVSRARAAKRANGVADEYVRPTQAMTSQAAFARACAELKARGARLTAAAVREAAGDVPGLSVASVAIKLRKRADGERAQETARAVREAPLAGLPVPASGGDFWIDDLGPGTVVAAEPELADEEATAEPEPPPAAVEPELSTRQHKAKREGASGRARRVQTDAAVLEIVAAMEREGAQISDTAVAARWGRSRAMAGYVLTRLRSAGHDIGRVRAGPVRDDPVVRVTLLVVVKEGLNPTYPLLLERLGWSHGSYRRLAASLDRLRRDDPALPVAKTWRPPGRLMQLVLVAAQAAIEDGRAPTAAEVYRRVGEAGRSEGNVGNALRKLRRDGKLPETPHTTALIRGRSAMYKKHEDKVATLDEARPDVVEVDTRQTRAVPAHRDHGVEGGAKTTSTAKLAAALGRPSDPHPVRGVLAQAELEDGSFVVRLTGASASMHALVQLASSVGAEVEIVVRRRE